jgi:hypothetical protein
VDAVEHQPKGSERLGAVLDAKTEQHCSSGADLRVHDRALACYRTLTFQPPAEENILACIAGGEIG